MDEDVDLAIVGLHGRRHLLDGIPVESRIAFVVLNLIRDVIGTVEDGIEGVDLLDDHLAPVGEDGILIEGSLLKSHLEDLEYGRPSAHDDGGTRAGEGAGDGPSVAGGVGNPGNEGYLTGEVNLGGAGHIQFGGAVLTRLGLLDDGR